MTPLKRNLSRLLFLTLVLTLGGIIFGVVYYLKMDRNEDTLNTLLFRELQQVEGTVQRSLEKVGATAKYSFPEEICGENKRVTRADCFFNSTVNDKQLEDIKTDIESNFEKLRNSSADLADIKVVGIEEVETKPGNKKEQYSFSFKIPQFNTVRFTQSKYYEKGDITLSIELESSIHYSLKQRANRFQTVALVAEGGEVKSVVNQVANLSNDAELLLRRVINLSTEPPSKDNCKPEPEDDTCSADKQRDTSVFAIEGTRFVDVSLSDSDYRAYIHPITSKGLSAENTHYYLVGVIKTSVINAQKLKLSPDLLMWLILALLLLIAIIPLIKLRFISATQAIHKGDKSQITLGLLVAVGIITIGFSQHLFFDYLMSVKEKQLAKIHQEIKQEFNAELSILLDGAANIQGDKVDKKDPLYYSITRPDKLTFIKNKKLESVFLESITGLDQSGNIVAEQTKPIIYISDAVKFSRQPDLTNREYLKAGKKNEYWDFKATGLRYSLVPYLPPLYEFWEPRFYQSCNVEDYSQPHAFTAPLTLLHTQRLYCSGNDSLFWLKQTPFKAMHRVYLQRIFNIEDGRRNLMLALPAQSNANLAVKQSGNAKKDTHMFIGGTRLSALMDRVLPNNFGFAVINEQGNVQFHNEDSLSLVENFFTETNRNPELLLASQHQHSGARTLIDVEYKGEPIKLVVGSLAGDDRHNNLGSGIPWQLIVYFNPKELQTNNMVLVFVAVLLFLLVLIPAFILLRFVTHQRFWQEVCGYDSNLRQHYLPLGLFLFAASLFTQLQMGWVQSVIGRLLLWAIICNITVYLFFFLWKLRLSIFYWWRQPLMAFSLLLLPLLAVRWLVDSRINLEIEEINRVSGVVGAIILGLAIIIFLKKDNLVKIPNYTVTWLKQHPTVSYCLLGIYFFALFISLFDRNLSVPYSSKLWVLALPVLILLIASIMITSLKAEKFLVKPTNNAKEKSRFTTGYVFFLTGLVYLGAATPASLIAYSAHDYLLQRQSQFEEAFIRSNIKKKEQHFSDYLAFINEKACQASKPQTLCDLSLNLTFSDVLSDSFPQEVYCDATKSDSCDSAWAILHNNKLSENTDDVFDLLFSKTPSETEFISHLTYAAKQDLESGDEEQFKHQDNYSLNYRTDFLMLKVTENSAGLLAMLMVLFGLPYGIYLVMRQLIVKRLLGEHLQEQYRLRKGCENDKRYASQFPQFDLTALKNKGHSQLILNTTRLQAEGHLTEMTLKADSESQVVVYGKQVFRIADCLNKYWLCSAKLLLYCI